jgi:hypothetical protein
MKDMIYDVVHQQEDVKTFGNQLIVRYTPSPARLQRVSKEFTAEFNRRLPHNQVHRLENTQKKLIFLHDNLSCVLPERMRPHATDATLVMNFNINDCSGEASQIRHHALFAWTAAFVYSWDKQRGPSAATTSSSEDAAALLVTVRFWICDMDVFDDFGTQLAEIWGMHRALRTLTKAEIMFYEREDHIAFPNEASVAVAKSLVVLTDDDGWAENDEAVKLAREVSKGRVYDRMDAEPEESDD